MGLFSDLQKVFERAIGLYTELDQPARAFDISERSRARALLDSVSDRGEVSAEASEAMAVAELQPLLRADETVVAYHSLPDRLLVWMVRSEEHTSELQSLMRISYAVFCLKKKKKQNQYQNTQYVSTTYPKKHTATTTKY